jgi:hypothetical protein
MSYYHPPSDEALEAFDQVCWALDKRADEDLYECARGTVLAFMPFTDRDKPWALLESVKAWAQLDAALAIVVTTAEPWDAILRAAAILREGR